MTKYKLPDNVKIHPYAFRTIREIELVNKEKAIKILFRLAELGMDPLPDNEDCNAVEVKNLKNKGLNIYRLKCVDFLEYRIFYSLKRSGNVCVYAIVPRDDNTYKMNSEHYNLIKLLYKKWSC